MIVVGTTLAAYVMDQEDTWSAWLRTAEELAASHAGGVKFFAAIETDSRGLDVFAPLLIRLNELGGEYHMFSIDDGARVLTTGNRLRRIVMGQNVVTDYCADIPDVTHMMFLAADMMPPGDAIPKLLEMNWPLCGGEVKTYCLHGTPVHEYDFPVEEHMATAAFLFVERCVFNVLRFRYDRDNGLTDDPAYHRDAIEFLGIQTRVRKDVIGRHFPEAIGAIETRGHDMRIFHE